MNYNYKKTTKFLFNLKRKHKKQDLSNIKKFLDLIGNPQNSFKSIHISGTNGKFSTAQLISSILQKAGYKVGTLTSPHLSRYTERIKINKKEISEEDVVRLFNKVKTYAERMDKLENYQYPSFTEMTTAIAFEYFKEEKVDFAICEVFIGGRLDPTNVLNSLISIITNVHLEHTHILGRTKVKIAREKAGIIKKDGILITAEEDKKVLDVFENKCKEMKARFIAIERDYRIEILEQNLKGQKFSLNFRSEKKIGNFFIPLLGDFQIKNASIAIVAALDLEKRGFKITEKVIKEGLKSVKCPGRFEIINRKPFLVLDCAKDPSATLELKKAIKKFFKFKKLLLVISISYDKNISAMIKDLSDIADFVVISRHKVKNRATDPRVIQEEFRKYKIQSTIILDIKEALKRIVNRASREDLILVTGSVFTVGEAREFWYNRN